MNPRIRFKATLVHEDGTEREVEVEDPIWSWRTVDGQITNATTKSGMRLVPFATEQPGKDPER